MAANYELIRSQVKRNNYIHESHLQDALSRCDALTNEIDRFIALLKNYLSSPQTPSSSNALRIGMESLEVSNIKARQIKASGRSST